MQELEYAENTNAMWYQGYDPLNTAAQDVLTAAEFDFKQAAVAVTISGLEELQNAGKEKIIDLLDARISNAEKTMKNLICAGIYSNGTGSGGKEIGGLQLLVADTATSGTVGGINRATWTFWQNVSRDIRSFALGHTRRVDGAVRVQHHVPEPGARDGSPRPDRHG